MSSSLSEERDRIQRQIQELEQSLSVSNADLDLLSSDSDDESEGDHTDEEAEQTPAGLLAQREKLQKQIKNLENVLGPHGSICVSDDDDSSSDESELSLPPSVDSCLQMNLVYQQVVQETLNQLEVLLKHNHRHQDELLSQLSGPIREPPREQPASSSHPQPNSYMGHFLKPYFKDKVTGLGPPANQETKEKAGKMTGCLDDNKLKLKRWESWQKTLLIHSVNTDTLKRLIQPKLSRVDYLIQKMSSAQETELEPLREQVEGLEKEVELLRGKKEAELVGDRYEEHDWQKISNIDFEGTRDAEDIRCFWQNFLHPSVNKSSWSQEEVQQLKEISRRHEDRNWEDIALELGTGRTAFMCLQTFQRFVSDSLKRRSWTPAEDNLLRELVERMRIGNFIPYTQISYFMEGREPGQLIYRWNQVLDPGIKKGPWSKKEDMLLLRAVARHGARNWWKIRLEVPGRTDNSCRDRYHDTLKEGVKRGGFDQQENEMLLKLVEKHGVGRWAKIAAEIPNRSDAQCLRAWKRVQRGTVAPAQQTNKENNQSHAQGGVKKTPMVRRRPIKRKPIKTEEEEAEFTEEEEEEEEEEVVQYMDSDEDEKERRRRCKIKEAGAENTKEEEQEEEHSFPPIQEWVPSEKTQPLPFPLVMAPPPGDVSCGDLVRFTVLGRFGRSVVMAPKPQEVLWAERHSSSAMVMVTPDRLQKHLGLKVGRTMSRKCHLALTQQLQAAVAPWVGHLLIPAKPRRTTADILRERGRRTHPSSTDVFKLLLQTMKVDATGSKNVIEHRRKRVLAPPTAPAAVSATKPMTVSRALQQKRAEQLHQDKTQPPQLILAPPHGLSPPCLLALPRLLAPPPQVVFLPPPVLRVAPSSSSPQRLTSSPVPSAPQVSTTPICLQLAGPSTLNVAPPPAALRTVFIGTTPANGKAVSPNFKAYPGAGLLSPGPSNTSGHRGNAVQETPTAQNFPPPQTVIFCPSSSLATPHPAPPSPPLTGLSSSTNPKTPPSTQKCPALSDHTYTFFEPHPTPGHQSSTHKEVSHAQVICDSASHSPVVGSSERKRKRTDEPSVGGADTEVGRAGLNMGGARPAMGGVAVTPSGKRIRKPSQKVRDLLEVKADVKTQRRSPSSSSLRQTRSGPPAPPGPPGLPGPSGPPGPPQSRPEVTSKPQKPAVTLLPRPTLCSSPGQSGRVMTPGGRVQLAEAPPSGLQVALVPSAPVPAPQGRVILTSALTKPHLLLSPAPSELPVPAVFSLAPPTGPPSPAAAPPPRTQTLTFDPSLMFLGPRVAVWDWSSGRGGVVVPGLGVALPYLPPFVGSLSTLSVLLRAKASLAKSSIKLLSQSSTPRRRSTYQSNQMTNQTPAHQPDSTSDLRPGSSREEESEEELVLAVRQLVAERFAENPAYQLLKARFLSCFTLPAFLATLQPISVKTEPSSADEEEEVEEEVEQVNQIMTRGRQRKTKGLPLQCDL